MKQLEKIRLEQAEWLCRRYFDHTADVLLNWDDPDYRAMPAPRDVEVTPLNRTGVFPVGPS